MKNLIENALSSPSSVVVSPNLSWRAPSNAKDKGTKNNHVAPAGHYLAGRHPSHWEIFKPSPLDKAPKQSWRWPWEQVPHESKVTGHVALTLEERGGKRRGWQMFAKDSLPTNKSRPKPDKCTAGKEEEEECPCFTCIARYRLSQ